MTSSKRVFGMVEAAFDIIYLFAVFSIGVYLLIKGGIKSPSAAMALLLGFGDSFHLIPRISYIFTKDNNRFGKAMGFGKLVTSVTMTVFYVILWEFGLSLFGYESSFTIVVYLLAFVRIILCFMPQNRWLDPCPSVKWGIYRNLPFLILGGAVALLFLFNMGRVDAVNYMWLAIVLSFGFYIPVVFWVHKNPKLGMLMLPKTCAYLWMLIMCVYI